jgi:hypothetical protein
MLSRHLLWERMPPGGVSAGEQTYSLESSCRGSPLSGPLPYDEHFHLHRYTIALRHIQGSRISLRSARAPKQVLAPWDLDVLPSKACQWPALAVSYVPLDRCSPVWLCWWADLAVPYVPLERCSSSRACRWAAVEVPLEHFAPRHVCLPEAGSPTWDAGWA